MIAFEGATDPAAWGVLLRDITAVSAVLIVVIIGAFLALLFWRGSDKLGIVGAGSEIRLMRQAAERNTTVQSALRSDFRVVVAWIARREGSEPPLPPIEESAASPEPAPIPAPPAHVPAAPKSVRQSKPSRASRP